MRSRTVSLPAARWRATRSAPPISRASASRRRSSSSSGSQVMRRSASPMPQRLRTLAAMSATADRRLRDPPGVPRLPRHDPPDRPGEGRAARPRHRRRAPSTRGTSASCSPRTTSSACRSTRSTAAPAPGTLMLIIAIEEIAKACASSALILMVQDLGTLPIQLFGCDELKAALPAEVRERRVVAGVRAVRARGRARTRPRCAPAPSSTATSGSSTAPRTGSPTPASPTSTS